MSIPSEIVQDLNGKNIHITESFVVTGGDINEAYKIVTDDNKRYFLKFNQSKEAQQIISSEIKGLDLLRSTDNPIPNQVASLLSAKHSYILMEWLDPGEVKTDQIAKMLFNLHKNTNDNFGLSYSNYIGSLPQTNAWYSDFFDFYITCRIEPQLSMAISLGRELDVNLEKFYKTLCNEIPVESPCLIHGDLWSGNMVHSAKGPYFIDPSVSYAHREMDLAMMRLFGGFPEGVYGTYHDLFPLDGNWRDRSDLFQLYYLLVHLNLFGNQYRSSVQSIFNKYD